MNEVVACAGYSHVGALERAQIAIDKARTLLARI